MMVKESVVSRFMHGDDDYDGVVTVGSSQHGEEQKEGIHGKPYRSRRGLDIAGGMLRREVSRKQKEFMKLKQGVMGDWQRYVLGIPMGSMEEKSYDGYESRMHVMSTCLTTRELKRRKDNLNSHSSNQESGASQKRRQFRNEDIKTLDNLGFNLLRAPRHCYFPGTAPEPLQQRTQNVESMSVYISSCDMESKRVIYERYNPECGHALFKELLDVPARTLKFESRFESGSLDRVLKLGEYEYELYLQTDPGAEKPYGQWFYFSVEHLQPGKPYRFHIMNFTKAESLFGQSGGCQPLVYSQYLSQHEKKGWFRIGENVTYLPNLAKRYTMSFTFTLDHDTSEDICYFAPCYPYRYSDLQRYLDGLEQDPTKNGKRFKRKLLCKTLAGNRCDMLTITSFPTSKEDIAKIRLRKGIVITARVHPGETNSSWVMQGLIDFLTGPSLDAKILRDNFVFKIVPMLNPDGVVIGNSRCSLAGVDLNRCYTDPDQTLHPTIWSLKKLIEQFTADREVVLFCDFHGHSRKHNIFVYGCESRRNRIAYLKKKRLNQLPVGDETNQADNDEIDFEEEEEEIKVNEDDEDEDDDAEEEIEINAMVPTPIILTNLRKTSNKKKKKKSANKKKLVNRARLGNKKSKNTKNTIDLNEPERVRSFPLMLHQAACVFSFGDCNFKIQKCKESSGRVCIHRESKGSILSYTLEASLGGVDFGPLAGNHLNQEHFTSMGHAFADAILDCPQFNKI